MKKISPKKILFIKLGESGKWEKECIEKNQTIRLSYGVAKHNLCLNGEWEKVYQDFIRYMAFFKNFF